MVPGGVRGTCDIWGMAIVGLGGKQVESQPAHEPNLHPGSVRLVLTAFSSFLPLKRTRGISGKYTSGLRQDARRSCGHQHDVRTFPLIPSLPSAHPNKFPTLYSAPMKRGSSCTCQSACTQGFLSQWAQPSGETLKLGAQQRSPIQTQSQWRHFCPHRRPP